MNRLVAAGLLGEMRAGKSVCAFFSNLDLADCAFGEVCTHILPGERVWKTRGRTRIATRAGGGVIYFCSLAGKGYRGLTLDLAYIEDVDRRLDPERLRDIRVAVRDGEVIRA